jgi:hypothetical protein
MRFCERFKLTRTAFIGTLAVIWSKLGVMSRTSSAPRRVAQLPLRLYSMNRGPHSVRADVAFEREKDVFPNQNTRRREPWIIRGPPPTTPAVVPTAVAVPLPNVEVILPKFTLLSLPTGLEKFV